MKCLFLLGALSLALGAQTPGTINMYGAPAPNAAAVQQQELSQAIAEANGSNPEIAIALERHLAKYPDTPQRALIIQTLYKGAEEANDRPRIIKYGEMLLESHADDELNTADHVIRALLASDDAESASLALAYAKRYEAGVEDMRKRAPEGHATAAQWADLASRAMERAEFGEARARGNKGDIEGALATAKACWAEDPTAECARETAKWLTKLGRDAEAIDAYAEAAGVEDAQSSWAQRDEDRKAATALYAKVHNSEAGIGDALLRGWQNASDAVKARTARFRAMDPNYGLTNAFQFHLTGVGKTPALDVSSLKGKIIVVDFWATWCLPCQAQHPILEKLRAKYANSPNVTFLSLDSDDDHSVVEPFLQQQKWTERVYLEGGLAGLMTVTSLPTILVIDPAGNIYTRLMGYSDAFEGTLTARIEEASRIK